MLVRRAGGRILLNVDITGFLVERTRQRQVPHEVEAVVRHRRDVLRLEPDEGVQHMQSRRDPRRLDLSEHFLQRLEPVPVLVPQLVPADPAISGITLRAFHESRIVDHHHPESTLLRERDVVVHGLWRNVWRPVDRRVHLGALPAFHAKGKSAPLLHRRKAFEKRRRLRRNDRRRCPDELQVTVRIRRQQTEPVPLLAVYDRQRSAAHDGGCGLFVPHHVQPVAEVRAVLHRQLHETEALHRRQRHL